jgi:hypothetical protein
MNQNEIEKGEKLKKKKKKIEIFLSKMSRKLKEVPKLVLLILLNFSAYKLRNV